MSLKKLHKTNAIFLGVFLAVHFFNHAALLIGRDSHLALMELLRSVYRLQIIEIPLFALFAAQIILGVILMVKRGKPKGTWAWMQAISGGYIAFFLLQHLGATVMARMNYDFETTTYFAAAVVSGLPYGLYFFPYYVLGITAIFAHIAAAARFANWREPAKTWHKALPVVGFVFALAVVTALSSGASEDLPEANKAYLEDSFGV